MLERKAGETTIVLCDHLIKLYLQGYDKKEMAKTFNINSDTYEDCVNTIKTKFGIDLQELHKTLDLKVP